MSEPRIIKSYVCGAWHVPKEDSESVEIESPVTGEVVGRVSTCGINFEEVLAYGRNVGGAALRSMTIYERALMLKELSNYLKDKKDKLYQLSYLAGATQGDAWLDIDAGIAVFEIFADKAINELPNDIFFLDGDAEKLSKDGSFVGQHIMLPRQGVAVHINAFNFPCWGMMEKLAPTWIAGMPAVVKPARQTCYIAEELVSLMLKSKILPPGALQLISGEAGDLFNYLDNQDVVTVTGSASTAVKLRSHPRVLEKSVRFNAEADSLNAAVLGADIREDDKEFELFINEVIKELTVKCGQKCTAVRRILVPKPLLETLVNELVSRLQEIAVGDPKKCQVGPLASKEQVREVSERVERLKQYTEVLWQGEVFGKTGAYFPIVLLKAREDCPYEVHRTEAFGPVSTIIPYEKEEQAIHLCRLGEGSLVASLFTKSTEIARRFILGVGSYHGRILIVNEDCAEECTGHGTPLPQLTHGGPGRAGGGEELGGLRALYFYSQRTALQGSPSMLTAVCNSWIKGSKHKFCQLNPFKKYFEELEVGDSFVSRKRTITEADIVNFAGVSGDFFYAHTDDISAKNSIFKGRVAHGNFILSVVSGLLAEPAPGPLLVNYGLNKLRFAKPVYPGDTIYAVLTCARKSAKQSPALPLSGMVEWEVEVFNQHNELVASFTALTLIAKKESAKEVS
ncbi:MAG: phenylacetic acid degradation bifunctional protein PaaZ [Candidatus Dadabacteria bacterium]|nr:MAG: phenylacetic acid degradation bifunctional protein PaaZ [Candidatus Dadabacteria bacterium]